MSQLVFGVKVHVTWCRCSGHDGRLLLEEETQVERRDDLVARADVECELVAGRVRSRGRTENRVIGVGEQRPVLQNLLACFGPESFVELACSEIPTVACGGEFNLADQREIEWLCRLLEKVVAALEQDISDSAVRNRGNRGGGT